MIDKLEFYHGAAIIRIVEDARCMSIVKHESGYLVNSDRLVFLKYSTKSHSPWRFTVSPEDIARLDRGAAQFPACFLALICGGDGICTLDWASARTLIGGASGWLAAKRSFHECYAVTGTAGPLRRKIALNRWPGMLFRQEDEEA